MYTEGNPLNFTDPTGHLICPNGRDPKTGNCLPNPINALIGDLNLPPVLTEILRQPSISPQKAYIILVVFGVYCTVQLLNTDKISTWEDILSLPVQQPTPIPIPQFTSIPPIPYHTPQPTPTRELHKHISLGRWDYLGLFTAQLNIALESQNAKAYMWDDWFSVELSDVGASMMNETFHIAFKQAIRRAEHIHFNLQGIINPKEWAETYGKGSVYSAQYITAWELYNIYNDSDALRKNTFYSNGFTLSP